MHSKNISNAIEHSRYYFMGMAMILIIMFHLGVVWINTLQLPFRRGFIGVDIFLFFSGYGCCYSLKNRGWGGYLLKRVLRVCPLLLFLALVESITVQVCLKSLTLWDWISNLTTLSYYGLGGFPIDWYLSSLVLLYLLFPILFYITKRAGVLFEIFTLLMCGALIFVFDLNLGHRCIIARLPVFVLGIWTWINFQSGKFEIFWNRIAVLSTIIWIVGACLKFDRFLLSTLFTPLLISILSLLLNYFNRVKVFITLIDLLGKRSLEIYVGNCLCLFAFSYVDFSGMTAILMYFVLTIVFSIFAYFFNNLSALLVNKFNCI